MASPAKKPVNQRIADALTRLLAVEVNGIVRGATLKESDRLILRKSGYLQEIIRGWYYLTPPTAPVGSTAWLMSFWSFLAQYLESRFGDDYCVSADASLRIQSGLTGVPKQISVIVTRPDNNLVELPAGRSIYPMRLASLPTERQKVNGVWCMTLEASLAQASQRYFNENPALAVVALQSARADLVERHLLEKQAGVLAARIAGAYLHIGLDSDAKRLIRLMAGIGIDIKPDDPFDRATVILGGSRTPSPYRNRLRAMWGAMRQDVLDVFPTASARPFETDAYLHLMDDVFVTDAYNSLSIEGYRVSPELIEKVARGDYEPESVAADRQQYDALAAKGYWNAFQLVKGSVARILSGAVAARVVEADHRDWNYAMCIPMIDAGLIKPADAAGYRNNIVAINGSEHVPPPSEAVMDCITELFELLAGEPEAAVRAVLGHFFFVFIHPLSDRNGRIGRFLMNAMLASGGYPWTVIRVSERARYMAALEAASVGGDIKLFAKFIADELAVSCDPRNSKPTLRDPWGYAGKP